jgi:hypothetical protein
MVGPGLCNGARRRSERGGGGGPAESAPRGESEASAASKRATARGARGVRRGGLLPGLQCMQYSVRIGSRGDRRAQSRPIESCPRSRPQSTYRPQPRPSPSPRHPPARTPGARGTRARGSRPARRPACPRARPRRGRSPARAPPSRAPLLRVSPRRVSPGAPPPPSY